jgi:hypothetical protein
MPMIRERYPADWEAISQRVRDAAGQRCQWCNKPNGVELWVLPNGCWQDNGSRAWFDALGRPAPWVVGVPGQRYRVRVVLTVAHLDHDTSNNSDTNLVALCQRCHLGHDRWMHGLHAAESRRAGRRRQVVARGQLSLDGLAGEGGVDATPD